MNLFVSIPPSHGLTEDSVIAVVDNEEIKLSDYQRFVSRMGHVVTKGAVDEGLLRRLIGEKIIVHEAVRIGLEASDIEIDKGIEEFRKENALSQDDFENMLAKEGMSIKSFRRLMKDKVISLKLVSINVYSRIVVADEMMEDFYKANINNYLNSPETVELKAVFLRLREDVSVAEVTDLKRKALKLSCLKGDNDFETLVSQYSDEPLRSQGGRLGIFRRGMLKPALDNKAFSMEKGEISEPMWVAEGAYILQLINKTGENIRPLEEVKAEIRGFLYEQEKEKLFDAWMRELWEKASVIIK